MISPLSYRVPSYLIPWLLPPILKLLTLHSTNKPLTKFQDLCPAISVMGCRSSIPPSSLPTLQLNQRRTALSSNTPPPPSYPLPLMIIWVSPSVEIRILIQHSCLPPISKIIKLIILSNISGSVLSNVRVSAKDTNLAFETLL